jgi:hypothetical protein
VRKASEKARAGVVVRESVGTQYRRRERERVEAKKHGEVHVESGGGRLGEWKFKGRRARSECELNRKTKRKETKPLSGVNGGWRTPRMVSEPL